jgi:hypothetical protein
MPSPVAVCRQINQILGYLVETGLASDQNRAFVRELAGDCVEVTFAQADHLSVTLKDRDYSEVYDSLVSERAYIAKLPDGALIWMRYLYTSGELERHVLGYYPSPNLEEFQNNPEIYLEDVCYAEVVARNVVTFPIRFDFDCREEVFRPLEHPRSHLTLGQYERCRIPVTAPITPYWFVSFLLRNFYHTAFDNYADSLPQFREQFVDCIDTQERQLIHCQIPTPAL